MSFFVGRRFEPSAVAQITEQSRVGKLACQGGGEGCSASVAHMRNLSTEKLIRERMQQKTADVFDYKVIINGKQ